MSHARLTRAPALLVLLVIAAFGSPAPVQGQADARAVFIANNGNLEGSVTAMRVADDGTLVFVDRVITGTRPSSSDPCPGCNAYEIALSPNGRHLATGHAASNDPTQQLTLFEVLPDGSITQTGAFLVPSTPMDLLWLSDGYLAVIRTATSPDQVAVYRFDPVGPVLTEVEAENIGTFCSYLALHPNRQVLYVNDSGSERLIRAFAVGSDGSLTLIDTESTGSYYGLELTLTHDGTKLYAAGGITEVVLGFHVAADGSLAPMASSPFPEAGDSPSNVFCSSDDRYLLVGHGTDATLRSAEIDPVSGDLAYTGHLFDVGFQGTLGDVATLEGWAFVTDNSTVLDGLMGIYAFTLGADGSFLPNGPIATTGGIAPRTLAVWTPVGAGAAVEIPPALRPGVRLEPNPARRGARVAYRLPTAGEVSVAVLDVTGALVRDLGGRFETAGEHGIEWDGRDDAGCDASAGIYFVRVALDGEEARARLVLLR